MLGKGLAADINHRLPIGYEAIFVREQVDLVFDYIEIVKKRTLFAPRRRIGVVYEDVNGIRVKYDDDFGKIDLAIRSSIKNH